MKRKASAVWSGNLKDGKGALSTESKTLSDTQYSFSTRFENGVGTNPEELIAAAHAGCFSMDLSARLEKAGLGPRRIDTEATLTLEKTDPGFSITAIQLAVKVDLDDRDEQKFNDAVAAAKAGCPVSKVLKADISVMASLA
ncbi:MULTISPECIES: OsmC family protein [unclassified Herbaspirillum]|uniref:OsmC family protein n=1 Tax=unclassified Herbaspirillum TaxID=2624150 RepID=UPI001150D7AA|nr:MULTISPECIES: OsmC family protein [unclassified Herbaspirillum]MBB5392390.1 osmotically inducible protein OsmC [Herbaspirillum sp. SJZ102]TQK06030.1 osmotically inducible protein OsmC [Herbaspirillum sp. SJZ130]TQK12492.1 osmotically inducible protein OsmC [Herbaspirillum sp. SJZ106]